MPGKQRTKQTIYLYRGLDRGKYRRHNSTIYYHYKTVLKTAFFSLLPDTMRHNFWRTPKNYELRFTNYELWVASQHENWIVLGVHEDRNRDAGENLDFESNS